MMQNVRSARVPPLAEVNPQVPELLARVVRRALLADQAERFQTANDFQRALEVVAKRLGWPLTVEALQPLLGG